MTTPAERKAIQLENIELEKKGERRCLGCKVIYPLDRKYFHKNGHGKLRKDCKVCKNRWRRARHAERMATEPRYRARVRFYSRKYQQKRRQDPEYRRNAALATKRWRLHQKYQTTDYSWRTARDQRRYDLLRALRKHGIVRAAQP